MSRTALASLALIFVAAFAHGQAPPQTQRIRGDIVSVDGLNLQVKERSGQTLAVKLADNFTVNAVVKIDIAKIVPGSFVGTATLPRPDGTQTALEVLLLPESRRAAAKDTIHGTCSPEA
jgi:hypothetical protein